MLRRMAEPLTPLRRNRDFVLFQTGQLLSAVGTAMGSIAYPLLTLAVTHSPAKTGLVSFAQFLPIVLFSLASGVAADRGDRKRPMIASDVVRAVAVGSLVAAILLHRLAFWQIVLVSFIEGTGGVFFGAGRSGVFKSVVPKAQLAAAASTEEARLSIVRLAGPPVGGALLGLGRSVPFLADAVSYAFSTVSLLAMRTPFQEQRERTDTHVLAEAAEGLRFVWANPFLRLTTLMLTLGSFSAGGVQLAVIVLAKRHGLSGAGVGSLVALVGATTLLGATASPLVRRVPFAPRDPPVGVLVEPCARVVPRLAERLRPLGRVRVPDVPFREHRRGGAGVLVRGDARPPDRTGADRDGERDGAGDTIRPARRRAADRVGVAARSNRALHGCRARCRGCGDAKQVDAPRARAGRHRYTRSFSRSSSVRPAAGRRRRGASCPRSARSSCTPSASTTGSRKSACCRSTRNECVRELRARHENETSGPLVVRLVKGVEEAARDESRENRFGRIRCVNDDLAAVGEPKDVNADADDVGGEDALRALELRSRSESSPHRPRRRAPATSEVEEGEPRALEDEESRPVECRAEDPRSAECEVPDAAVGREDADRIAVADDGNPARIEGGDGRCATELADDRLSHRSRLPDTGPMDVELATAPVARVLDVERDHSPVRDEPAEKRSREFPAVRMHELGRPDSQRIVDVVALARCVAAVADAACGEQHVVCAATSAHGDSHAGPPDSIPDDDRTQRTAQAGRASESLGNCGPVALGRQRDERQPGGDRVSCGQRDERQPGRRRPGQRGLDPDSEFVLGAAGESVRHRMPFGAVGLHPPELHVVDGCGSVTEIVAPVEDVPAVG